MGPLGLTGDDLVYRSICTVPVRLPSNLSPVQIARYQGSFARRLATRLFVFVGARVLTIEQQAIG
jgi:hypothetical protein